MIYRIIDVGRSYGKASLQSAIEDGFKIYRCDIVHGDAGGFLLYILKGHTEDCQSRVKDNEDDCDC